MRVEVKFSSKRFLLTLMLCACSVILLQNHDLSRDASFTFRLLCLAAALLFCFGCYLPSVFLRKRGEDILSVLQSRPKWERWLITAFYCGYFRYTAARCCEIEKLKGDICSFRLTPNSLSGAEKAGISRGSFLALLRRFSGKAVPPTLASMLASDDKVLIPATIYNATILTVPQPEILTDLLGTSRLEKWILQQINENSLMIDPKGIDEFRRYLMEKEIFVDIQR